MYLVVLFLIFYLLVPCAGKFSAKGYFLQSLLCHLAQGDAVQVTVKLEQCKNADYTFGASRECGFIEKLLEVWMYCMYVCTVCMYSMYCYVLCISWYFMSTSILRLLKFYLSCLTSIWIAYIMFVYTYYRQDVCICICLHSILCRYVCIVIGYCTYLSSSYVDNYLYWRLPTILNYSCQISSVL